MIYLLGRPNTHRLHQHLCPLARFRLSAMPKVEVEYVCKKCKSSTPRQSTTRTRSRTSNSTTTNPDAPSAGSGTAPSPRPSRGPPMRRIRTVSGGVARRRPGALDSGCMESVRAAPVNNAQHSYTQDTRAHDKIDICVKALVGPRFSPYSWGQNGG